MRRFVRHPSDIPMRVELASMSENNTSSLVNLSVGGVCCLVDRDYPIGTLVNIDVPHVDPAYHGQGVVVWCNKTQEDEKDALPLFEIGIRFKEGKDAFRSRMIEQLCQIEHYKNEVALTEGRELSPEEAAGEWIKKYAANFDGFQ